MLFVHDQKIGGSLLPGLCGPAANPYQLLSLPLRPAYTACYSSSPHAASLTAAILLLCCSPSGHTSFLLSTFTFHMPYTSTQRLMLLLSRHPGRCRLQSCIEKRGFKVMTLNRKLQLQQTPSLKEGGDGCDGSSRNPTTALLSPPVNLLHQQSAPPTCPLEGCNHKSLSFLTSRSP